MNLIIAQPSDQAAASFLSAPLSPAVLCLLEPQTPPVMNGGTDEKMAV